jgi:hypothetical protein
LIPPDMIPSDILARDIADALRSEGFRRVSPGETDALLGPVAGAGWDAFAD